MSTIVATDQLRKALEDAGEGWIFSTLTGDVNSYLARVAAELLEFADRYGERFHERPDPFRLFEEAAWKGKTFFQLDTLRMSTEMKIMVWRILVVGCDIDRVRFEYDRAQPPKLTVTLSGPGGQEEYTGEGVWDFTALRHFGPSGVNDRGLLFTGYYPLRR